MKLYVIADDTLICIVLSEIRQIYSISIILIAIKIIIIINIIIIIIFTIIIAINNRLAPEMVEDLVTLKCNLHLLREQPSV